MPDPSSPAAARRIFNFLFPQPADQRANLLDQHCGDDTTLRAQVESLLAAADFERSHSSPTTDGSSDDEVTLLDGGSSGGAGGTTSRLPHERPGTQIGPYTLLHLIGQGGFGSVFKAEQTKPVARQVALKIIKLGMDTRQVVARFEQERQALAMMDHPNIARVIDAGATDTGRPYFVMDFVQGDPILEYCDKHRLNIADRLELFIQVCQAVQHAHTKGIIHRDLKSSNILISTIDGRPVAKVIDFGIAKATASKIGEFTVVTEIQQFIGTPDYMSPEQANGSADVDTRADIYALGVLLYALLTGTTPFSPQQLRSAPMQEVQRVITEVDPPRPSVRLTQLLANLAAIAAARTAEPRKLTSLLSGDLDWIVMKAIEKDRARRYETANGFAADVRRFLSGEPVLAAPPSASYRFNKLIRRNRGLVSIVAAAAISLLVGAIGFAWQASVATKAERVAESRLAESEATVKFLDDMLASADPGVRGKDVTVRSVLDEASKSVGHKFADKPLIAARLHGTIGRTFIGLGAYDAATAHIREAVEIRRNELGESHPDTRHAINQLAVLLIKQGSNAEAEKLLKASLDENTRLFGRHHLITIETLDQLAVLYTDQDRVDEAEPIVKEVLDAKTRAHGPEAPETIEAMNTLASLYTSMRRFNDANALFDKAISLQDKITGPEHPFALEIRSNYAWSQYWQASNTAAHDSPEYAALMESSRVLSEKVLEGRARLLGEEHQATITSMNNLAAVYVAQGNFARAEELRKKDVDISVRTLGEDHPDTITSLSNYGNLLTQQKRFSEALPYLERAALAARRVLPSDNPGRAFTLGWYSMCLTRAGRPAKAESPALEARAIAAKVFGENDNITMEVTRTVISVYTAWDKLEPGKGHDAQAAEWRSKVKDQ
jgi:serine/threonine protein kinase/Tfp pilus assembly protein PilF